jgi:hypothetical protein
MRPMAGVARIVLTVVGVLLILVGVAMAVTSQAELWYAPVLVGALEVAEPVEIRHEKERARAKRTATRNPAAHRCPG